MAETYLKLPLVILRLLMEETPQIAIILITIWEEYFLPQKLLSNSKAHKTQMISIPPDFFSGGILF